MQLRTAVDEEIEQLDKREKILFLKYLFEGMPWKGSMWFQVYEQNTLLLIRRDKKTKTIEVEPRSLLATPLNQNNWLEVKRAIANYYTQANREREQSNNMTELRALCDLQVQIEKAWPLFKKEILRR